MKKGSFFLVSVGLLGMVMPGALAAPADTPQKELKLPKVSGYLLKEEMPNSLKILTSPPPTQGSAAEARDREANEKAVLLHGSKRWEQAAADAVLEFPDAVHAFDCTMGIEISPKATPRLYNIMQRSLFDFGLSTSPTKKSYMRTRPFMVNDRPICTPEYTDLLRHDGSYPSGHSAIGFGWGLVLSAIAPEKTEQLMSRGIDFGDSRAVCNVHWQSDVEAGRIMASAVYARLTASRMFMKDVEAARAEYRRAVAKKATPKRACPRAD